MKTENCNGYDIRFVEVDNEWYAVAKDVAEALGYSSTSNMMRMIDEDLKGVHLVKTLGGNQKMLIISEAGIYQAIFGSKRKEAKTFRKFVTDTIKALREETGLQGFEVFRLLDKDHQKKAMFKLRNGLKHPVQVNFIKANTVANKAISNKYGYPKMVKKGEMSPQMLVEREPVLDDIVQLMELKDKYNLDLSVSKAIYQSMK